MQALLAHKEQLGATGTEGTKIYLGTTAPASTLVNNSDFYLNVAASDFYGPKTAACWGVATNLKGATGATGAAGTNGSKIYSGSDVPAALMGVDGDYCQDIYSYSFYRPKTSCAWAGPIQLQVFMLF